ncbi:MAG: hypothetical protein WC648_01310 [Candidatus Paceibacterota bacterium]|jgi:hypothetical protein
MNETSPKFMKVIKEYWFIGVLITSLIVGWANLKNSDVRAAERIATVESQYQDQQAIQTTIQVQLSQIQTDLAWIKTRLSGK